MVLSGFSSIVLVQYWHPPLIRLLQPSCWCLNNLIFRIIQTSLLLRDYSRRPRKWGHERQAIPGRNYVVEEKENQSPKTNHKCSECNRRGFVQSRLTRCKGLVEQLQQLHQLQRPAICVKIDSWDTGKKDNFIIGCPNLATSLTVFSIIRQQFALSATGKSNNKRTHLAGVGDIDKTYLLEEWESSRGHLLPALLCIRHHVYPDFVQKLGDFCYRSSKEFGSSVDKTMAGVFVLFPMLHPQFQPVVPSMTDHVDIWTTAANDGC
ncbi:hypothetical protein DAPPUDRAFT_100144 [Daphnia pulex]|uniref:Uncharacterized protein n=1 Tax=Daphnia pulex TaxID=6669 RepID=E9G9J0_DAPPU|nr:hypothetical protein DAPPUDRAFT_100144 [Daphnia pulex]|eukprot:EFX83872.1 hypothetical protein DAPPUDRAFT_100144 [Daphnia pulex]